MKLENYVLISVCLRDLGLINIYSFLFSFPVIVEMNSQVDSVNDPTESQQD